MLTGSIAGDIKHQFRYGNMVMKLIFVNIGVFLFVNLFYLIFLILSKPEIGVIPEQQLSLHADLGLFIRQPWSLITYMFMHKDVFHILFNMLWLYWFGEIFVLYLGESKVIPLYFIGGLSGALLTMLAVNFIPVFEIHKYRPMVGASAAVLAFVFAAATINPDHRVQLPFIGGIAIKYIAVVPLIIHIIAIRDINGNVGGNIAHLGGAISGYLFIKALQSGFRFPTIRNPFSRKSKVKVAYKNTGFQQKTDKPVGKNEQQRVDEILDKIARSGYDSLSKEEKDFLFHYSKK